MRRLAKLVVEVTADDIAQSERNSCTTCPVALAAARAMGKPVVIVNLMEIRSERTNGHRYVLPPVAKKFVKMFDAGFVVYPFSFDAERIS